MQQPSFPQPRAARTRRARRSIVPRPARLLALGLALCLAWSFVLAMPAQALTTAGLPSLAAPLSAANVFGLLLGHPRPLLVTPTVVRHVVLADCGGAAYPWQASSNGTNLVNGNKLIQLPLVSWAARGGLPVALTLSDNSQATASAELGPKWTQSYDIALSIPAYGQMAVTWGDGSGYTFSESGATFTPPAGIHDALVKNADGTYTLTKTDQTQYHFTTGLLCDRISDEDGNAISIARNASGQVSSVTDPTGRALTLAYSGGLLHTVTDPLGRVWTLSYDASNDLASVALPPVDGATYGVSYGYNGANDVTGITDPRGETSTLTYTGNNSLASETDPLGHTTAYAYTSTTATVTDPNGHAAVYTYDSGGRVTQVTDAAGYSEYDTWDASNDKTQVEDKRGFYRQYTYDGMGNVLTQRDPYGDTTSATYNGHNRPLTETTPGGEEVVNTYDATDDLTQVQQKGSSGAVLATTTYTVGPSTFGLVTAKTDPDGHTYSYGYDANGDLTSLTTPLGRRTQWACDALGSRTSRTDALGRTTTYGLDGWERTASESYPGGSSKAFSYDADGDVTGFTDGTGTTTRTYDADDRLLSEAKNGSRVVSHSYDASGQLGLLSTTTDANGRVLTYAYTSRGQLASVTEATGAAGYGYDADGDETAITNENGTTVSKSYDEAGRLSAVVNRSGSGTTLSGFSYSYNSDGLRSTVTEADGSVVTYGYDGLLHLSSEVRTGTDPYSASYAVDGAGQRTAETVGGVTTAFTYDADAELLSTSGGFTNSYAYDLDGEQTSRTLSGVTSTLTWDFDNQLVSAGGASFAYDAEGRRVSRTAGGVTTSFLYDGSEVLLEKQGSTTTATYTYGNALVRKDGETPLFDGLGSERTVTNTAGAVQGTLTATAFGQSVASTGSSSDPYEFAATSGYRNDGDAGLTLDGARYYDAQTGSFISRDTYLDQLPYAYCNGDPVNKVDPSGHQGLTGYLLPRLLWNVGRALIVGGCVIIIAAAITKNPLVFVVGVVVAAIGVGIAETGDQEGGNPNDF